MRVLFFEGIEGETTNGQGLQPSISVEKVCIASHGVTKPTQATCYFDAILTLKDLFE